MRGDSFFTYHLYLDNNFFGVIYSEYKLLSSLDDKINKKTYGRFNLIEKEGIKLTFLNEKKFKELSSSLFSVFSIENPTKMYLIPSSGPDIIVEKATEDITFISRFVSLLNNLGINIYDIYVFPDKPNISHNISRMILYDLKRLKETNVNTTEEQKKKILDFVSGYFHDYDIKYNKSVIFPSIYKDGNKFFVISFAIIRFILYFSYVFTRLVNIIKLAGKLGFAKEEFCYLIEVFTIEYIPSFTNDHNFIEKIGDSIIDVFTNKSIITSLVQKKTFHLTSQIKKTVSNRFFNVIAEYFEFENCLIGPNDCEKVLGDCFEALIGIYFLKNGYDKSLDFWKNLLFTVPRDKLLEFDIMKTIELAKTSIESYRLDLTPCANPPSYLQDICDGLVLPPQVVFDTNSDFSSKCKLFGITILKHAITLKLSELSRCNFEVTKTLLSKEYLNDVATKLGMKNSKILRMITGAIFIQNDYHSTLNMIMNKIIPLLNLDIDNIPQSERNE